MAEMNSKEQRIVGAAHWINVGEERAWLFANEIASLDPSIKIDLFGDARTSYILRMFSVREARRIMDVHKGKQYKYENIFKTINTMNLSAKEINEFFEQFKKKYGLTEAE